MSGTLRLRGATSGYSELQAPAVAADQTFILPTAGGTLLTTDSPIAKLTLQLGSASQPSLTFEGDTDTGLYSSGTNTLNLVTGGSDRLVIDSSGRLLVGTTSSSQTNTAVFQGNSSGGSSPGVILASNINNPSSTQVLGKLAFSDNGHVDTASIKAARDGGTWTSGSSQPSSLGFFTTADGASSPAERLRIDSSGNVGIGTTSPTANLHGSVSSGNFSTILESTATSGESSLVIGGKNSSGTVRKLLLKYDNSDLFRIGTAQAVPIRFETNDTERMRINSSGQLLLNTTSARTDFFGSTGLNALLNVEGTNNATRATSFVHNSNDASQHLFVLGKSRGTSAGSNTVVQSSDNLGGLSFHGADGSKLVEAARVEAQVDGTPGSNDMPGRLVFSTTADGASSPTERMRIDSSGNVGIGTTSPSESLEVAGNGLKVSGQSTGITDEGLTFDWVASGNAARIFSESTGSSILQFYTTISGARDERMRINSSGNVGIGTTAPQKALQVGTHGSGNGEIAIASSTSGVCSILMGDGATGTDLYRGYIQYNNSSDAMLFATSAAERMRIDSSGRVRIGQTSGASVNLSVYGSQCRFQGSSTGTGESDGFGIGNNGATDAFIWNYENGYIQFGTNATERMRIDSGGVVFTRNPTTTSLIAATGAAASGSLPVFAVRRSSTAITSGTDVFYVYSNGSYATISDQNQKKNIESTRDGYLDDLNRLRVVKYNWNEQEDTDPKELGLIAQEVEQVFPGLISEMNEDGEETTKGIKYSVLPVMLLKALQEASAKIETLEAEVAALKNN